MMRTLPTALCFTSFLAAQSPAPVFIDPNSRWLSIHDKSGTGAALEITADFLKTCPEGIAITDVKTSAKYTLSFNRTGSSAGTVVIYTGGKIIESFTPGHSATLRKVAERVCEWIAARQAVPE